MAQHQDRNFGSQKLPEQMGPQFAHPDVRSELVIQTHDVPRGGGEMKEVQRAAHAPAGMGTDVIGVAEGSEIDLDVRLESVTEGILVTGTATAVITGSCSRCLDPIDENMDIDLCELFLYPENVTDFSEDSDELAVVDDMVDLEHVIRDGVVLDLPFTPLCHDDCLGLCLECGININDDPEHTHGEKIDARWGDLAVLVEDKKVTE